MTLKEAIDIIDGVPVDYPFAEKVLKIQSADIDEAYRMAMEVLQKQVQLQKQEPLKPIKQMIRMRSVKKTFYACPACGETVGGDFKIGEKPEFVQMRFCCQCGQHIDWKE